MPLPQILTAAKLVVSYINQMHIDQDKNLQLDIKEIHQEINNFHQEISKLIEQKITDIRESWKNNTNNNFNSDIYNYLEINEIAKETEDLVSRLTKKSKMIQNESSDSTELLSYLKAVEKYFKLFDEEALKKNNLNNLSPTKILNKFLNSIIRPNITQEESEAIQAIDFLNQFKIQVYKYYMDIRIKYIDLDRDLSNHWISRKSKKLYYKIKKNPFKMTALLLGLTTLSIGTIVFTIDNYYNIKMYIKYTNLQKKKFVYSTVPIWSDINKEIIDSKEYANIKLIKAPFEPKTAISDLINGKTDFVQSIGSLTQEQLKQADERKIKLKVVTVGYYLIAIAVNKDLNVNDLTNPELKKIYTGEINNWKQLNGPDLQIKPYALSDQHPTTIHFKQYVLGGRDFGHQVVQVTTNTKALQMLKQDQGGIYFGIASEIVDQCSIKVLPFHYDKTSNPISPFKETGTYNTQCLRNTRKQSVEAFDNEYNLYQPIIVIYKEDDKNNSIGDFYSSWLLSDTGQKLIKKAYFIPSSAK